jgi:serine phosphatase RsbU (regulator of sigma subunit)
MTAKRLLPGGNLESPRGLRHFFFETRLGKLFLVLVVIRLLGTLLTLPFGLKGLVDFGLWIYVVGFIIWGVLRLRTKLLWRIRRKLIISYLLIGLVPTVLILFFFLLTAYLVFGQVSSYILTASLAKTEAEAIHLADLAVSDLQRARGGRRAPISNQEIEKILQDRLQPFAEVYPGASAVYLEETARTIRRRLVVGHLRGLPLPGTELPEWAQETYGGLMQLGDEHVVTGFSKPLPKGSDIRVLVTLPLPTALRITEKETELQIQQAFPAVAESTSTGKNYRSSPGIGVLTPPPPDLPYSLPWVAVIQTQSWGSDENALFVLFRFQFMSVFRAFATNFPELGQAILAALGILALLFLAIEVLSIFVGLLLARSITGSIHTLSKGTEHVRNGDFSYKLEVRSNDQLGELAESFNLMTSSIQDLLRQSAEKERLEEELRIARQIQMSLLPKDRVTMPGLSIAALCLPATEVGGDYYDFISIDEKRLALLIADVSGKGTSAALYMAELKGLVLSLSKIYDSPRKLLIEANKILAENLDSRSFITMAYAVIDMHSRQMTFARAGHNPIYQLPADGNGRRTRVLAPEGLGLALDRSGRFEKLLAEECVRLEKGDLFLFFTDGLSEAMNPRADLFGESRLREILEQHSGRSLEDLREKIIDEIFTFAEGEDQHDDMTMVLVKIH